MRNKGEKSCLPQSPSTGFGSMSADPAHSGEAAMGRAWAAGGGELAWGVLGSVTTPTLVKPK